MNIKSILVITSTEVKNYDAGYILLDQFIVLNWFTATTSIDSWQHPPQLYDLILTEDILLDFAAWYFITFT